MGPLELDPKEVGPFPCTQLCWYTMVPTVGPLLGSPGQGCSSRTFSGHAGWERASTPAVSPQQCTATTSLVPDRVLEMGAVSQSAVPTATCH